MSQREASTPDLVEAAVCHLHRILSALWRLQPHWLEVDLTMAQTRAFLLICSFGTVHGRALAKALGIGQPAVSKLVEQLVSKGLVMRREDTDDRRIAWLAPTAEGEALFERLALAKKDTLTALLGTLDPDKLEHVGEALSLLADAAEELASRIQQPKDG